MWIRAKNYLSNMLRVKMEPPKKQPLMERFIRSSMEESKRTRREYSMYGRVYVYIQDFLPENVDMVEVIETIEDMLPPHVVKEIDTIFVGTNAELEDKEVTAMYDSGAIYISNNQKSVEDMVDDIVHEIAHSLEQPYGFVLYSDGVLEKEFLNKRLKSYDLLSAYDFVPETAKVSFMNVEYSTSFDTLLYKDIGYERLAQLLMGVYTTPYAATSLREYFATGFEDYFMHDAAYLKKISPNLFNKVDKLVKGDYDG